MEPYGSWDDATDPSGDERAQLRARERRTAFNAEAAARRQQERTQYLATRLEVLDQAQTAIALIADEPIRAACVAIVNVERANLEREDRRPLP